MVVHSYKCETGVVINIDWDTCEGCGNCANGCPTNVFFIRDGKCTAPDIEFCIQCGSCEGACVNNALSRGFKTGL